jgi:hypothetical protein
VNGEAEGKILPLAHDPIRLNRIMISSLCLSMIFSENRCAPRIKRGAGFSGSCCSDRRLTCRSGRCRRKRLGGDVDALVRQKEQTARHRRFPMPSPGGRTGRGPCRVTAGRRRPSIRSAYRPAPDRPGWPGCRDANQDGRCCASAHRPAHKYRPERQRSASPSEPSGQNGEQKMKSNAK